jgi:hypothetical protein
MSQITGQYFWTRIERKNVGARVPATIPQWGQFFGCKPKQKKATNQRQIIAN